LKFCYGGIGTDAVAVTPHAGVWIEISVMEDMLLVIIVTPHAGVWIEIQPLW